LSKETSEKSTLGRKPIPVEMRRSERACAMFTKPEIQKIETWIDEQEFHLTLSDAIRALALRSLDRK